MAHGLLRSQSPVVHPSPTILQRVARGDASAVAAFLDEYADTIYSIAHRYLRPYPQDLDDAVQEVCVEIWKSAPRFDPAIASEPAFVATIAHRRLIDQRRRAESRHALQLNTEAIGRQAGGALAAEPKDPAEVRDAVAAFRTLDEDERHLIWLAVHHGLSHEQIARACDMPLGTVKTRIRRGMIRLRDGFVANGQRRAPGATKGGAS